MREYIGLYRGKRTDNGEWVEGAYIFTGRYHVIVAGRIEEKHIVYGHYSVCVPMYVVDPDTVCECTGLKDKNGKLIFEGDILEGVDYTAEDGGYGVVSFNDGAFEVNGSGWNLITGTFHDNYWGKDFEIIGNIHDNPELLGGGEE